MYVITVQVNSFLIRFGIEPSRYIADIVYTRGGSSQGIIPHQLVLMPVHVVLRFHVEKLRNRRSRSSSGYEQLGHTLYIEIELGGGTMLVWGRKLGKVSSWPPTAQKVLKCGCSQVTFGGF